VKLAAGSEMDAGNLVDDVAQQVAADHAVQPALNLLRACCGRDVSVMLRWIFDGTSMVLRWYFEGFRGFSLLSSNLCRPPARRAIPHFCLVHSSSRTMWSLNCSIGKRIETVIVARLMPVSQPKIYLKMIQFCLNGRLALLYMDQCRLRLPTTK
jgi:hypothetical protein